MPLLAANVARLLLRLELQVLFDGGHKVFNFGRFSQDGRISWRQDTLNDEDVSIPGHCTRICDFGRYKPGPTQAKEHASTGPIQTTSNLCFGKVPACPSPAVERTRQNVVLSRHGLTDPGKALYIILERKYKEQPTIMRQSAANIMYDVCIQTCK